MHPVSTMYSYGPAMTNRLGSLICYGKRSFVTFSCETRSFPSTKANIGSATSALFFSKVFLSWLSRARRVLPLSHLVVVCGLEACLRGDLILLDLQTKYANEQKSFACGRLVSLHELLCQWRAHQAWVLQDARASASTKYLLPVEGSESGMW